MDTTTGKKKLIERLSQKPELFIRTREQMGVTPAVGLAVIPVLHDLYTAGAMSKTSAKNGSISLTIPGAMDVFSSEIFLEPEDIMNLVIIWPDYNFKHPHFVSLFQRAGLDSGVFEKRLLTCNEEVMRGLYGHEMAHWGEMYMQLPREIAQGLETAVELSMGYGNIPDGGEVRTDLIAARYGLKKEIIAKADYMIECLSRYSAKGNDVNLRTPCDVMAEVMSRKRAVETYS